MPEGKRFDVDSLSEAELEQMQRFIEEYDVDELSAEMRARREVLALAPGRSAAAGDPLNVLRD
jgi:hypothetical protein